MEYPCTQCVRKQKNGKNTSIDDFDLRSSYYHFDNCPRNCLFARQMKKKNKKEGIKDAMDLIKRDEEEWEHFLDETDPKYSYE